MYIYLLHFDDLLSHSQHYLGVAENVRERLQTHANGRGSRICEELVANGTIFRLGAVASVTKAAARRVERHLKNGKNLPQYCEICNGSNARRMPETLPISLELLPFDGSQFQRDNKFVDLRIREGAAGDHGEIMRMMNSAKAELGYLTAQAITDSINARRMAIAEIDRNVVGYATRSVNRQGNEIKFQQVFVKDEHRLKHVAASLLNFAAAKHPAASHSAHVREDLPANLFWTAQGFTLIRRKEHATSKKILNQYFKPSFITQQRTKGHDVPNR